jgi:uncharacterized repeat protein (TIGR03843 family)
MAINANDEIQEAVRLGAMKITGRLVAASNATMLAKVDDGLEGVSVIYKPIAGERPLWDFPHGSLADRELATYLLSAHSGFDLVPYTVLREGPFGPGAVQLWIDIDDEIDLVEFFQSDTPALRKMALFDAIVNNTDRKIGHILPSKSGDVFGCDHGVTFHEEDKLRTVLWQWAGESFTPAESDLLRAVGDYIESEAGKEFVSLLTASEIEALRSRVERLNLSRLFPHPSPDWPSVPWPPF